MAEKKKSNPEQSYRRARRAKQLQDRITDTDVKVAEGALGAGLGSAAGVADEFFKRNEFKEGFYSQPSQPAITAETMYGKGTKRGFEYPTVDPDTKMMQDAQGMAEGGSVRGQKNIQVKKKSFRGIF
jgi:hypothetical protein